MGELFPEILLLLSTAIQCFSVLWESRRRKVDITKVFTNSASDGLDPNAASIMYVVDLATSAVDSLLK